MRLLREHQGTKDGTSVDSMGPLDAAYIYPEATGYPSVCCFVQKTWVSPIVIVSLSDVAHGGHVM